MNTHSTSRLSAKRPSGIVTASLQPALRVTLAVLFILAALYCLINTLIIALATTALVPAFINFGVLEPSSAILGFCTYAGTTIVFGALTIFSILFAHHCLKSRLLTYRSLIAAAVFVILAIIFIQVLLPLFVSTLGIA